MTNEEKILEILNALQKEMAGVKEDIATMKDEMGAMKEDLVEVRGGVNTLLDWAEQVGGSIEFPLPKIM